MSDEDIDSAITKLVEAEHHLRSQSSHSGEQKAELSRLEASLDQCWDLLRQRDALRAAGSDPSAAEVRPVSEVEGYQQ